MELIKEGKQVLSFTISQINSVEGTLNSKKIEVMCSKLFLYNSDKGVFLIFIIRDAGRGRPYKVVEKVKLSEPKIIDEFSLIKNSKTCRFSSLTFKGGSLKLFSDKQAIYCEEIEPRFEELLKKAINNYFVKKEKKITVIRRKKGNR